MKYIYGLSVCVWMLAGCAEFMGNSSFQSIRVGNGGRGAIIEPSIQYGSVQIINKSQTIFQPPTRVSIGDFVVEGGDFPIADFAKIKWKSGVGSQHAITVPIGGFIRDKSIFYGWHFVFADDDIDIYLIERKKFKVASSALETIETKVFSSNH